jgi:hypothetical protein
MQSNLTKESLLFPANIFRLLFPASSVLQELDIVRFWEELRKGV